MLLRALTKANFGYILACLGYCWLLVASFVGCARPAEFIQVGDTIIYGDTIDKVAEKLKHSFNEFGDSTLRSHLLMNGLAESEILHQSLPSKSIEAKERILSLAGLLGGYKPEDLSDAQLSGLLLETRYSPPNPSQLGANIAAEISTLEPNSWSEPFKTKKGWSIVYLHNRDSALRSKAAVNFSIISIDVGSSKDHNSSKQTWNTTTLTGSNKLISCLPYEFRVKNKQ